MKKDVIQNEERLNKINKIISNLKIELQKLKDERENIILLNKYYGSTTWYKDIENFDEGKYGKINAGVLSEDAIWNMNENINELKKEIQDIKITE